MRQVLWQKLKTGRIQPKTDKYKNLSTSQRALVTSHVHRYHCPEYPTESLEMEPQRPRSVKTSPQTPPHERANVE